MSKVIERQSLYFREGSSDKVYSAELVEVGPGACVVNFAYGRRGAPLQTGTKTTAPVPLDKGMTIFKKLLAEKTGKGYTPDASGTPYQDTPREKVVTGIVPQLLNDIDEAQATALLSDPDWVMQEKHDGRRTLAQKADAVVGINRKGLAVSLPMPVAGSLAPLPLPCTVDGEGVGDVLFAFDLLAVDGRDIRSESYGQRLAALSALLAERQTPNLRLVRTARTTEEKTVMFAELRATEREGAVFKRISAAYRAGRPNSGGDALKFKFYATASCIVTAHNDKRSVAVSLYDGAMLVPCGNVTIPPNFAIPSAGALVEVRYLYAYPVSNALYQPVYLGPREDIEESDCVLGQLKYKAA